MGEPLKDTVRWTLQTRPRLDEAEIAQVRALTALCNRHDGLNLKINWELLATRDGDRPNDFLGYAGDELIVYAALDGFGHAYETTGMVHPAWRRRGVFRRLFEAVLDEARTRRATDWLLVCERTSATGQAWVRRRGATYRFSEFHMELDAEPSLSLPPVEPGFRLELAGPAELDVLVDIDAQAFGDSLEQTRRRMQRDFAEPGSRTFLARMNGESVGKVGVVPDGAAHYLRGVAVRLGQRGRGYGRQILSAAVQMLMAEGARRFSLDVEAQNDNALRLYQSCGFRATNNYDYFAMDVGV